MKSNAHWSNYWQNPVLTSLPDDYKRNYDGEILEFWAQQLKDLSNGDSVLDICTGNGAIAIIAAEMALSRGIVLDITAVDISEINTAYIEQNIQPEITSQIKFISDCPIEHIQQKVDKEFDMITSQYGLEYTDLNKTAPNLHSITKPEGCLAFVAHSHDSEVFRYMQVETAIYQWLIDINVFSAIDLFVRNKLSANGLKNKLNQIVKRNQPNKEYIQHPLFKSWQYTLSQLIKNNNQYAKSQRQMLTKYLISHKHARQRALDMVNVAQKVVETDWVKPIEEAGFKQISKQALHHHTEHKAGDAYVFRK